MTNLETYNILGTAGIMWRELKQKEILVGVR